MFEILVIDDDPNMRALLKVALEELEMHPVFVHTGEEGVNRLRQYFSDIVLLDINLPGKNGIQILKQIRSDPALRNATVVMLTASRDKQTLIDCARLGISDYIAKPFSLEKVTGKLSMIGRNLAIERKSAKATGISQIKLDRDKGRVLLTFLGVITGNTVNQFKNLYTDAFAMMTKKEPIIFNLRVLPELDESQMKFINEMALLMQPKNPIYVAGRNYGPMIPWVPDFETRLFIIEEDAAEYLNSLNKNAQGNAPK